RRRIGIQKKIIEKVFVGNGNASKILKCILGAGQCPRNADSSNPDNKAPNAARGSGVETDDEETTVGENDGDDGPAKGDTADIGADGDGLAGDVLEGANEAVEEIAEEGAEQAAEGAVRESTETALGRVTKIVAEKIAAPGPQRIWSTLKTLASVHNLL